MYIFKNKKSITITYVVLYVILSLNFRNINNYYFSKLHEYEIVGSKLPILKIEDIEGKVKNVNNCNKILIIDLWSNSCGYCIEAFPEFQKVYNYYKNDKEVEVFSVNVDDSKPNRMMGHKLVKKYGFKNFFASKEILKQLKFNTFPHYMIVSKDGKIKYFGSLNTSRVETYNNIYDLVQNEK
ncbi:TlpA disulfide reductase family protein [Flavobacterium sp. 20NA77.7]|uniref:TlpA disulfide reductase family protein n=1 Tax=Flavobacterium nakdongensis TaxID=3073563 RepID=A0ABY9R8W4_9FLAO|nr:TlpA disulfide reductase family protein [Flavobacterium sp. 20NA77.7]WMW77690.1 TlpA disulfide reductase family protein [Flavobacterium sp. 20NA77.7]